MLQALGTAGVLGSHVVSVRVRGARAFEVIRQQDHQAGIHVSVVVCGTLHNRAQARIYKGSGVDAARVVCYG